MCTVYYQDPKFLPPCPLNLVRIGGLWLESGQLGPDAEVVFNAE